MHGQRADNSPLLRLRQPVCYYLILFWNGISRVLAAFRRRGCERFGRWRQSGCTGVQSDLRAVRQVAVVQRRHYPYPDRALFSRQLPSPASRGAWHNCPEIIVAAISLGTAWRTPMCPKSNCILHLPAANRLQGKSVRCSKTPQEVKFAHKSLASS